MRYWIFTQDITGTTLAARLLMEGCEVYYSLIPPKKPADNDDGYKEILNGFKVHKIPFAQAKKALLNNNFQKEYKVIFSLNNEPEFADDLRRKGYSVLGSSVFGQKLEHDRKFGLDVMKQCGIPVPESQEFSRIEDGLKFLQTKGAGKRWVIKPDDCGENLTFVSPDNDVLSRYMQAYADKINKTFVLQEVKDGITASCEGWFDGQKFVFFNCTLEKKRESAGDVGCNLGCRGDLCFAVSPNDRLVRDGVAKIAPILKKAGYRGMIDLNQIVTKDQIWGLEWTPRFGYNGSMTLIGEVLALPLNKVIESFANGNFGAIKPKNKFGMSLNVDVSFPKNNLPIMVRDDQAYPHLWFYDVKGTKQGLATTGCEHEVLILTASGQNVQEASLPHTCGGEPYSLKGAVISFSSSPHMWG